MKKVIVLFLCFIFLFLITSCQNEDSEKGSLDFKYSSIKKVEITGTGYDINEDKPFDNHTKTIIEDMIDLLNSAEYVKTVVDTEECVGGNPMRFNFYLENGDHYKIYDASVSNNHKCYSYLKIEKNGETFGYTDELNGNDLLKILK